MKNLIRISGFFLLLITFFASCSKDDEVLPDYVGTWVMEGIAIPGMESSDTPMVDLGDMFSGGKVTLVLTTNTFDMLLSVDFFGQSIPFAGAKGDFVVNGNKFKQTIKQAGVTDLESGEMTYYGPGTPEFAKAIGDGSATMDGEYSVSGNKLTLKTDSNGNGAYETSEIQVFTKK